MLWSFAHVSISENPSLFVSLVAVTDIRSQYEIMVSQIIPIVYLP